MSKFPPISLKDVRSYPLSERASKVKMEDFARPWQQGETLTTWLKSLPDILAGKDFPEIVRCIVKAAVEKKTIILGMGAHAIKVGLNPVILDLLDRKILSGIAMNGAGIIHDAEVAMVGQTSEDVAAEIGNGRFGMADETGKFLNHAISKGAGSGIGIGESVGAAIVRADFPYRKYSLLARAYESDIPVTVHVAIGTDIIHFHPDVDAASIGGATHLDFRIFSGLVSRLEGGVFINLGSAVIIPEVFLKALSLARNLGHDVHHFTTVNMDFIRQYRPMTNVVDRPTQDGGRGYNLIGHHEIMFPLLAAAIVEGLSVF